MLNLKSWSQEHPREPLLLLVVLCAVLTGYVYTASPEPHSDHSAQAKYTARKTLPTAGPLLVEAPVFPRTVGLVSVAETKNGACVHHDGDPMPSICLGCDKKMIDELKKEDEASRKKWWPYGYWEDPTWPGLFWREKSRKWCEKFHAHPVPLNG